MKAKPAKQAPTLKKHFIAGAQCPACGSVDTIYTLKTEAGESMHCASCGFQEQKPQTPKAANTPAEPVKLPDS